MRSLGFLFVVLILAACVATPAASVTTTPTSEPTRASTTVPATATSTLVAPSPTLAPVVATAASAPAPSPQPSASSSPVPSPQPTASSTLVPLLPPPQLAKPETRASYAANSPVILTWTWERALQSDEHFQVQLSKEGSDPKDFGCIPATTYVIAQPPFGYGWYQWRVLVRRGKIQGDQCTPQNDVSRPSEIRTFEWRLPPEPPSPEPPTPRPYP